MSNFAQTPTITDPDGAPGSQVRTLAQVKENIEWAFGTRGGKFAGFSRVLVSDTAPAENRIFGRLRVGTLWVNTSASNKLMVWLGHDWQEVT